MTEHREFIRAGLASAPQTNEVGRSAALFGGLLQVLSRAQQPDRPVRLVEIGASAGLNLLADHFTYRVADGNTWPPSGGSTAPAPTGGPQPAPVVLDPAWESWPLGIPDGVEVVERLGCDLAPIDARSQEGALSLLSCVWPDQTHRLDRLRGALALAQEHAVTLERAGGGDFLDRLALAEGRHTVVAAAPSRPRRTPPFRRRGHHLARWHGAAARRGATARGAGALGRPHALIARLAPSGPCARLVAWLTTRW